MNRQTKLVTLSILTVLVVSSIAVAWHFTVQAKKPLPDKKERRNIEIYPRECKLYPNQTQLFHVNVYDGVPPFSFRWYVNGTFYADTATINFQFEEPTNYVLLSVFVTDEHGNVGWDEVLVYDPAFTDRPRYLEAPLPLAFLVESNSTHTAMYNGSTLQRTWVSTSGSAVINSALGNLTSGRTWQERVLLKGEFTADSSIELHGHTILTLDGKVTASSGITKGLIVNYDPSDASVINVVVEGGTWSGQYATSGDVIYWETSVSASGIEKDIIFRDLKLIYAKRNCLTINNTAGSHQQKIENIRIYSPAQYGIYLFRVSDTHITNCKPIERLYMDSCSAVHADELYVNNGLTLYKCKRDLFTNVKVDTSANIGISLLGTRRCQFTNIKVKTFGDGTDIEAGIRLSTSTYDSTHNIFTNVHISRKIEDSGTREFTVGIKEESGADYNIYSNVNAYDTLSGFTVSGTHSHICCSWDDTTWVDYYP